MNIQTTFEIATGFEDKAYAIGDEQYMIDRNTKWVEVDDILILIKEICCCGECPWCCGDDTNKGECYNVQKFIKEKFTN